MTFKTSLDNHSVEYREITEHDILQFKKIGEIYSDEMDKIKISSCDIENGSPKAGDTIATDARDNSNQWLVSGKNYNSIKA